MTDPEASQRLGEEMSGLVTFPDPTLHEALTRLGLHADPPHNTSREATMSRSRDIGTATATAVVKYLRTHGWPHAERRALTGAQDQGDITGTPGICWEVKGGKTAEQAGDGLIADWLDETETERRHAGADIGILITKRKGYSAIRAASWIAHLDLTTWYALTGARAPLPSSVSSQPVHLPLSTLVPLLHAAGYGTPTPEVAA